MGDKILILPDIHARPFWKKAVKENIDKVKLMIFLFVMMTLFF